MAGVSGLCYMFKYTFERTIALMENTSLRRQCVEHPIKPPMKFTWGKLNDRNNAYHK